MFAESEPDIVSLSSLESVDGSEFLVICPYESSDSVEERLGFSWAGAPDYALVDDQQAIVIIDGGQVVSHAKIPRNLVDFCFAGQWEVLPVETGLSVTRSTEPVRVSVRD